MKPNQKKPVQSKKKVPYKVQREGKVVKKVVNKVVPPDDEFFAKANKFTGQNTKLDRGAILSFNGDKDKISIASQNVLFVNAVLNTDALFQAGYILLSRLYTLNVQGVAITNDEFGFNQPLILLNGVAYLINQIQSMSTGGPRTLEEIPRIFHVLNELLKPKSVRFHKDSVINYTATWNAGTTGMPSVYTTPLNANYYLAQTNGVSDIIPIVNTAILPQQASYVPFLKMLPTNFGCQLVADKAETGMFMSDPSVYARNYAYFGSGGPVGGCYSNVELEVPFNYPSFSKFINYPNSEDSIGRVFKPISGGIGDAVGKAIVGDANYSLLKNPIPTIYKFIDFAQVYTAAAAWLAVLLSSNSSNQPAGGGIATNSIPIPISKNDFCWILRSAILANSPEQCYTQFMSPLTNPGTASNSAFIPFIVDSLCYPVQAATAMLLPVPIVENLCMLRGVNFRKFAPPGKYKKSDVPKKLSVDWVPVWGVYSGDTLPDFTWTDSSGAQRPLFSTTSLTTTASLIDASINSGNKFNVNKYIPSLINAYNSAISVLANRNSVVVSPVSTDRQLPSLLPYTRILGYKPIAEDLQGVDEIDYPAYKYIINHPGYQVELDAKQKKKITVITPATQFQLYTDTITSIHPMDLALEGYLRNFILPTLRPESAGGVDNVTPSMWQVYTMECCSTDALNFYTLSSVNEGLRLFYVGEQNVVGAYAPSNEGNVWTKSLAYLSSHGYGSIFLSSLLSGLKTLIPLFGPLLLDLAMGWAK